MEKLIDWAINMPPGAQVAAVYLLIYVCYLRLRDTLKSLGRRIDAVEHECDIAHQRLDSHLERAA